MAEFLADARNPLQIFAVGLQTGLVRFRCSDKRPLEFGPPAGAPPLAGGDLVSLGFGYGRLGVLLIDRPPPGRRFTLQGLQVTLGLGEPL